MTILSSAQLAALYHEIDLECAQLAREQGPLTAAQMNLIAARLMQEAHDHSPATNQRLNVVGPHGT